MYNLTVIRHNKKEITLMLGNISAGNLQRSPNIQALSPAFKGKDEKDAVEKVEKLGDTFYRRSYSIKNL